MLVNSFKKSAKKKVEETVFVPRRSRETCDYNLSFERYKHSTHKKRQNREREREIEIYSRYSPRIVFKAPGVL